VKTYIISKNKELVKVLNFHLKPLYFDITNYNDPVKALKILDEQIPELIIYNVADFPRHWKPFLRLLRDIRTKEQTVFILIKDKDFPFEEAAKAIHLGTNGIIDYNLKNKREIYRLKELFKRYRNITEKRRFIRIVPDELETFHLLFTNPNTNTIITGFVTDISIQGAMFKPQNPLHIANLQNGQILQSCSLQIGSNIISLECKVTRIDEEVGLEFTYFDNDAHHKLFQYLMDRPDRQLKHSIKKNE